MVICARRVYLMKNLVIYTYRECISLRVAKTPPPATTLFGLLKNIRFVWLQETKNLDVLYARCTHVRAKYRVDQFKIKMFLKSLIEK